MEFVLSLLAMLVVFVVMLTINYAVYKREKTLLEINEKYKKFYNLSLEECVELKSILVRTDKEKEAYKRAIEDCIENFNTTYSNTKLSFDEAKCAFVIEDIDVDDSLPAKEETTPQNENNNENQQSI